THVSAYMLKLEEGTPLYKNRSKLHFPDEDAVCDFYLQTVKKLEKAGFYQYEISNFAKPGYESRHNTNYWLDGEYLGIGPSAHSFIGGKRFFYERDFSAFLSGCAVTPDGDGGDYEEYVMLRLRLAKGINAEEYEKRFGRKIPEGVWEKARQFEKSGHMKVAENSISLTAKGFLLSNYIIEEIIEQLRTSILN
ncbi:MAG: coproporphyrinogen III oxidase, partial [Acutalibacteraceae bacterium]